MVDVLSQLKNDANKDARRARVHNDLMEYERWANKIKLTGLCECEGWGVEGKEKERAEICKLGGYEK